jgi:GntR family transcriptional regulator, transcriptional repressor for pyruvate dehydrogenase complex
MFDNEDTVRVQKTHEVVAERLRRQIVQGKLPIGRHLPPEEELTAALGIARTTLREALRVLESQGLIEIRRGRGGGPIVTQPDMAPLAQSLSIALQLQKTNVGDLDQARQLIEPQIVARLAASHTKADLALLDTAIANASAAAEANDVDGFARCSARMHEAIMECSANNTLATLSKLLHEVVESFYKKSAASTDQAMMRRAVRSYQKLRVLIESGDGEAASEHWRRQMNFTIKHQDASALLDMYERP